MTRSLAALGVAGAAWGAAVGGRWWGLSSLGVILLVPVVVAVSGRRRLAVWVGILALAGWWSGLASAEREASILAYESRAGPIELEVVLADDPRHGDYGWWALARADPPRPGRPAGIPYLLAFGVEPPGAAGDRVEVSGSVTARSGTARGDPYSGVLAVDRATLVERAGSWWWRAGNAARSRTLERLHGGSPARALLAGFLVGDTSEVPEADMEAMRLSGLTHLVAVSGSNVALFLGLTVVAAGPLAAGPRRRAVVGLAAILVLVIATRWEPSVVRASVMAALVLGGRLGGWSADTLTALAATVILVVTVSGDLATDVGFTLSVLATLGVIAGGRFRPSSLPGWAGTTLAATAGAQLAVAPVLITVFGSLPLMAPISNLVAIPVVAASTTVGAIGVALGWEPLIWLSTLGAEVVLAVARLSAPWPQIGWMGFAMAVLVGVLASRRRLRPLVAMGASLVVAVTLTAGPGELPLPAAVFLDVGQGDAIVVVASDGRVMLVDGGPDPAVLEGKLATYGINRIEMVVLTHVHADHAAGLEAVIGRRPVGSVWLPGEPHSTPASRRVAELVAEHGVPATGAPVGEVVGVGDLSVEVLGPIRRYASPNDQSTVLRVRAPGGPSLLLTGDIETYAQDDLAGLVADILKVPHQGGATSDLDWLSAVGASRAVISVGVNDFGHPSPEVIDVLIASGAEVARTDQDGDVVIPLR